MARQLIARPIVVALAFVVTLMKGMMDAIDRNITPGGEEGKGIGGGGGGRGGGMGTVRSSSSCPERRGHNGTWVPSRGYDYASVDRGGIPLANVGGGDDGDGDGGDYALFAPHTRWTWREDHDDDASSSSSSDCRLLETTTARGMCDALERLGYRRIFFIGDSLTYQMVESLWKLLVRADDEPGPQFEHFSRTFDCGGIDVDVDDAGGGGGGHRRDFEFEIAFTRTDDLSNITEKRVDGTHHYLPWALDYVGGRERTILVANTGMHTPSDEAYRRDLDSFLHTIELMHRPEDMVVYRTSVPGHADCGKRDAPLARAEDFRVAGMYNWPLVEGYNRYAEERLSRLMREGADDGDDRRWMLLDVYPMTILRQDGHRNSMDCLHYLLPGVPDFWVHLFYSNLLSMVNSLDS